MYQNTIYSLRLQIWHIRSHTYAVSETKNSVFLAKIVSLLKAIV